MNGDEIIQDGGDWRMFLLCSDAKTCVHPPHVKSAKEWFGRIMSQPSVYLGARLAHERKCDMWAQQAHGGVYVSMAERYCGVGAVRHSVCIANKEWFLSMWLAHRLRVGRRLEAELLVPSLFDEVSA